MRRRLTEVRVREALVIGGSGQIGRPLLDALRRQGWHATALSRDLQHDEPGLRWLRGHLGDSEPLPERVDAILACGPLDVFARWYAAAPVDAARVVAFGSTSLETKQASPDPAERELAERLRHAEARLLDVAAGRGVAATLLRPTLVYGAGRDATLTRIAGLARRWGRFPLPRGATGLRQPVHVADLADAAVACLRQASTAGHAYALPGGETLPYREMVRRVVEALDPPARLLELPAPAFALALRVARATGRLQGFGEGALVRLQHDLVFDLAPARTDFGYAPRPFRPTATMFPARA